MILLDTIETLCCLDGVSGAENEIRDYILERIMEFADEISTDALGNILAFKKGKFRSSVRLMLSAHMDEVGLIITDYRSDGSLNFAAVGGINPAVLPGKKVFIGENRLPGFISLAPPSYDKLSVSMLSIDIGCNNAEESSQLVSRGDYAAFSDSVIRFGSGLLKAKALDDRVGCAAMLKLMESDLPCDCWFAFTVQEEVGCRGAGIAARQVQPDIALILEGTTAADLPGVYGAERTCEVGKGIVLPYMDGGAIYDRALYQRLGALAEKNGIPWQTKTKIAGGTDAQLIQRSGTGCRVAAISVAIRNIHSPASIASIEECENQLKLASLFLEDFVL